MKSLYSPVQDANVLQFPKTAGRTVGILLLLQLAAALTFPFILSMPVTLGSSAFLSAVAEHSTQIQLGVLLSFVGAALTVSLGIAMFRVFWFYSLSAAQLFLVACAVSCTVDLLHAGTILSMLSISSEFMTSNAADAGMYRVIGEAVATARHSTHSIQLLAIGAWMFIFYFFLFRFKLLPLTLALLGILGVALQVIGVTVMLFLGFPPIGEMAMPLLPIQITVAVWLITKGFKN